ncbi:MAG: hypothetical protein N3D11_15640 [Candidatus Sumerlaeia bacterium]|nr:hypothetical protein [Candidatus Sumerlaeia bacterium]
MWNSRRTRRIAAWILAAVVAGMVAAGIGVVCPERVSAASAALTIRDPQAIAGVPDVAITVRINRLDQLFPRLDAMIAPILPGMGVEMLKLQLGNALGDPTLTGVDQTRAAMICVFAPEGGGEMPAVALVPVASAQLKTTLEARGSLVYQKEGGKTLLVADVNNEKGMTAGRANFDKLEAILAQPVPSDVSVYVNVELLMARYEKTIENGLAEMMRNMEQMQKMMGQPGAGTAMLGLQLHGALSVIKELKDLGVDLSLKKEGAELGLILRAKPDTALAKVLDSKPALDTALLNYLPRTGSVVGFAGIDSAAPADYIAAKFNEVMAAAPKTTATAQLKADQMAKFLQRTTAMKKSTAFDFLAPGTDNILNGAIIYETSNANEYLKELRTLKKTMDDLGLTALYKGMGMDFSVTFQDKVRDYKGTPIHKMTTSVNMAGMEAMPGPATAMMKMFTTQEYEIAAVDNYVIHDLNSKRIDPLIDALKAKKAAVSTPLRSQSQAGGMLYVDLFPARLGAWGMQIVQSFAPPGQGAGPQFAQVATKLKTLETEPVTLFAGSSQGKLQATLFVPVDPIVKIRDAVMQPPQVPQPIAP